jgi:hypothetical protein
MNCGRQPRGLTRDGIDDLFGFDVAFAGVVAH